MARSNHYDVTLWPIGNPFDDIGEVMNSIITDIKNHQGAGESGDGGKPGAVIHIPPGDYRLRTQVLIDIAYLRIEGSGHGFTSSSIRFNMPEEEWSELHELWPGGSRILVDHAPGVSTEERAGAAFVIERAGSPRISSIEFANFCIDGLRFAPDGSALPAQNTYVNGKTGIYVACANDSLRITGMGLVYLEHALTIYNADALTISENFIAECGNCIELRGWGQASKITGNHLGAGFKGYSIHAESHGGLLITANNVFPRGASSVHLDGVTRSSVTGNRLHSFYPGMVVLSGNSSENLVSANHFLRDHEPWTPFLGIGNERDDTYGLVSVCGSNNSIISNHFSVVIDARHIRPSGDKPIIIRVVSGLGSYIATNHIVAMDVHAVTSDSCFTAQVGALLATEGAGWLDVTTVFVDADSVHNTVLDSGTDTQVSMDRTVNAFRATPTIGN
jgi:inulin fructotransferase (DFA-I-forming)